MSKGPIRRGQLIAPFGVGSLVVVRDGTSVIAAGLDHWYVPEGGVAASQNLDVDEYKREEWRLQKLLNVNHFRLPPDYRHRQVGQNIPNTGLTVPFLRFPIWHFCPFCKTLQDLPSSAKGYELCKHCLTEKKRNFLFQVPFIAVCDHGHLQDFPWREWVHRSAQPVCDQRMTLVATGGASLADQKVTCGCGKHRSLASITMAEPDGSDSFLSKNLAEGGAPYRCGGLKPWLGDSQRDSCNQPLRGSLRSASNVYFARVYSAIYLPRSSHGAPDELVAAMNVPPLSSFVSLVKSLGGTVTVQHLRQQQRELLAPFTDSEISKALAVVLDMDISGDQPEVKLPGEPSETSFRRAEFEVLKTPQEQDELLTQREPIANYSKRLGGLFSNVTLVHKLRETRAFAGFGRVFPDDGLTNLEEHKARLWRIPPDREASWLPANVVYGEGIFLQLDENRLHSWEEREDVKRLIARLSARYLSLQKKRKLRDVELNPRFVLLHTLAHVLINKLTFECGYGSSSLRERLYVSSDRRAPMAGLLIYTAAGDSEGTMGGLVRMGKPGYLEPVIEKAIRDAEWCSTDPVCMEIGERQGQGPDGCNGAACHNCALVPETACEHFNRFLDRALIVGTRAHRDLGYFSSLLERSVIE